MQRLGKAISKAGFMMSAVYCADGTFINEPAKYISACLTALSTMTQLGVPHLNVLTKCDKLKKAVGDNPDDEETLLDQIVQMGAAECLANVNQFFSPKFYDLNKKIVEVIENFNLVQYIPLNIQDEDSVDTIIQQIDNLVQYDEYRMPKEGNMADNADQGEGGGMMDDDDGGDGDY